MTRAASLLLWPIGALALILIVGAVWTAIGASRIAARFPPEGRFVDVAGGRLHLVDRPGDRPGAPALLMIHGASSNHAELPLALGQALGGRYRIISVDRPGHGWSERIGGAGASSPARQAAVVAEAAKALGVGKVVVVAHSLAGAAAMQLALDHSDIVAGLVLISPATHPWPGGVTWYYTPAADPWIGPLFTNTVTLPLGQLSLDAGDAGAFAPQAPPADYVERAKIPLVLRPPNFQANAQDVSALLAFVTAQYRRYASLTIPVAIVTGDTDSVVSPTIHSQALAREIGGAELTVLPGVGHAPHHFAPDVVAGAIDRVAARIGSAFAAR